MDVRRTCKKCGMDKPTSEFYNRTPPRTDPQDLCVRCYNDRQNAYNTRYRSDRARVYRNKVVYCDHPECVRIDRQSVLERGDFTCGICHDTIGDETWHMDHIIPVSKKGKHCYYNLQPSHPSCNLIKGDTILVE